MELTLQQTANLWEKVLETIKGILDVKVFSAFFENTKIVKSEGTTFYVLCDGALSKAILDDKYKDDIENLLNRETFEECRVVFVTDSDLASQKIEEVDEFEGMEYFKNSIISPNYTFNNFIVGKSNKEAQKASLIVANDPGKTFQTLFLYGGSGLGKTHLLNAIGNEVKKIHPELRILYCSSQDFLNEYLDFINAKNNKDQLNKYLKKFDVFLIDDIQMLKDKRKTQEFFFNIYEDFRQNHKQFVITSDKLPSELDGIDQRIITRFTSGLAVPIYKPDTETCVAILKEKIQSSDFDNKNYTQDAIYFLAEKFKDSIRSLEGALIRLNFYASINKCDEINVQVCTEALQGMIDVSDAKNKVSVQKILNTVASYYGLSVSQLTGKSKNERYVFPRQVSIYLIRDQLGLSLKKIGDIFSNRDHSTIMHSLNKIEQYLLTDKPTQVVIGEMKKRLQS